MPLRPLWTHSTEFCCISYRALDQFHCAHSIGSFDFRTFHPVLLLNASITEETISSRVQQLECFLCTLSLQNVLRLTDVFHLSITPFFCWRREASVRLPQYFRTSVCLRFVLFPEFSAPPPCVYTHTQMYKHVRSSFSWTAVFYDWRSFFMSNTLKKKRTEKKVVSVQKNIILRDLTIVSNYKHRLTRYIIVLNTCSCFSTLPFVWESFSQSQSPVQT